jgi:hypothetical protein
MTVSEIAGSRPAPQADLELVPGSDYHLPPKRKIKHLSKGVLALAPAHEPNRCARRAYVGLDTAAQFLKAASTSRRRRTVFLSSHQIGEVERVADIVGIMRSGKLLLVERLETLKDQIRELSVTLDEATARLPAIEGQILRERRHHQQVQLLVRGMSEEAILALRSQSFVNELGIRTPSLEEIFVAYLALAERGEPAPPARPSGGAMSLTPLSRLVWKEYRAVRAFWVSLVVLAFVLQGLIVATSNDAAWNADGLTFAARAAFFAVGCGGGVCDRARGRNVQFPRPARPARRADEQAGGRRVGSWPCSQCCGCWRWRLPAVDCPRPTSCAAVWVCGCWLRSRVLRGERCFRYAARGRWPPFAWQ